MAVKIGNKDSASNVQILTISMKREFVVKFLRIADHSIKKLGNVNLAIWDMNWGSKNVWQLIWKGRILGVTNGNLVLQQMSITVYPALNIITSINNPKSACRSMLFALTSVNNKKNVSNVMKDTY